MSPENESNHESSDVRTSPLTPTFVLVHGPRKGGTTMLQGLLDTPGRLMMRPGELKLKRLYVPKGIKFNDQGALFAAISDTYNGRDTYYGDPGASYRSTLDAAIHRGTSVADLVTLEVLEMRRALAPQLASVEPELIAFKEVGRRVLQPSVLQAARLLFPRLKVVLITRAPWAVASAVYRERRRRRKAMDFSDLLKQAVEPWQVLFSQMALADAPLLLLLSYEALVLDPPRAAARLETFLELPSGTLDFVATTEFGKPTTTRTASVDASAVFVSQARWYNRLNLLQVTVIVLTASVFQLRLLLMVLIRRSRWTTYRDFTRAVDAGEQIA
jgi:hypothetical protein